MVCLFCGSNARSLQRHGGLFQTSVEYSRPGATFNSVMHTATTRRYRQGDLAAQTAYLVDENVGCLEQAENLLRRLPDELYVRSAGGPVPQRASSHLRHVVEFYEALLNGLAGGEIDYDRRQRDQALENSRFAALQKIRTTVEKLHRLKCADGQQMIWTRIEDAADSGLEEQWMPSSLARELQFARSHTIHHFALISGILRSFDFEPGAEFGVAPSTLRHLRNA
jgi:hypothetical protein